jgi:hypothetical protein
VIDDQSSRWRAAASPGGLVGLVLVILVLTATGVSVYALTGQTELPIPDVLLWGAVAVGGLVLLILLYLIWAYLSIRYQLDADYLQIRWGFSTTRVPIRDIVSISPAMQELRPQDRGWQPIWPGYYVATRTASIGRLHVIATSPLRRQVLIRLRDGSSYVISPERPLLFMEELARWRRAVKPEPEVGPEAVPAEPQFADDPAQRFVEAGWTEEYSTDDVEDEISGWERQAESAPSSPEATEPKWGYQQEPEPSVEPEPEPWPEPTPVPASASRPPSPPMTRVYRSRPSSTSPLLRPILLQDPVALSLAGIGILATVLMIVFILVQYDDIPPSLTLHWNVEGQPGRIGEPREIWLLPTITGIVLLANIGLAWSIALFDRFAARLILSATILVHLVTWVALINILR